MDALFCFIDDAKFELDNFRKNGAPAFKGVEFVYAHTFDQAQGIIGRRDPLCFLLDLYGATPDSPAPCLPDQVELVAIAGESFDWQALYRQADADSSEGGNRFLRRLHGQVQAWQNTFAEAADSLGQSPAYGLENLAQVKKTYPRAVALAYSRKAAYADAAAFCMAGGDGILQKPQGADDQAIALATSQQAPKLARVIYRLVESKLGPGHLPEPD